MTAIGTLADSFATTELAGALAELARRICQATVEIATPRSRGAGSGVVWSAADAQAASVVVTNAHVARGEEAIVRLFDGRSLRAPVVARDPARDLAVLAVDAAGLAPAPIGDSDALRAGELVFALGSPLGVTGAAALGIVHRLAPRGLNGRRWIEADVRLAPGNSGGPLADAAGRVIGINTMVASGLALAIPSRTVARFLRGGVRPSLGVAVRPAFVRWADGAQPALLVLHVEPAGAAAKAGLAVGDVLIGAAGQSFAMPNDLTGVLDEWDTTRPLELDVVRGGARLMRPVVLSTSSPAAHAA